jgi:tetrapyrrole methylase family protein/MazG family protein
MGMPEVFQPAVNYTIEEIDSALTAGQVKLRLMEYFPEEWEILFSDLDNAGLYQRRAIPLFELDRQPFYGPSAVIHVPAAPFDKLDRFGYEDLCRVIRRLRAPGGCPWDREQTHDSLKVPLMEECYELLDAIDEKNDAHLTEELGDVLMQVVFHDEIAAEQGRFTGRDVTTELVQKLIYRHPHVFGDAMAATSQEVLVNWDKLKKKEKGQITQTDVLLSVPRNLPALTRAKKIQKKAGDVGFDWDSPGEALTKVYEEAREVEDALKNEGNVAEETGDLLFAAVNVIRLAGLDPELTLLATCDKFIQRFAAMEKMASDAGNRLEDLSLSQQDALWNEAKNRRN